MSGIDAAQAMVDLAKRRLPEADLRVGPIEQLPWSDGVADEGAKVARAILLAQP